MSEERTTEWPTVTLGSLLKDIQPGYASGIHNSSGVGLPHFRPMNVSTDGRIDRTVLKFVDPSSGRNDLRLCRGDVLFNNTNSPELVGKTALFEDDDAPAFSNHMTRLRVDPSRLYPGFLALRLHQTWREGWFAAHCNNHVSQASIGRDVLRAMPIELPPIEVQREIAALAHAVDQRRVSSANHLSTASKKIERFRQSVLASACSGRLTDDWRAVNTDQYAPSVDVFTSKRRKSDGRRFTEPEFNAHVGEINLPDQWHLVPLGLLLEEIKYGTSHRSTLDSAGIPVLRIPNVSGTRLDISDLKYAPLPQKEASDLSLTRSDLLMIRSNGSVQLVGKTMQVTEEAVGMAYAGYLMRLRPDLDSVLPEYLVLVMATLNLRAQIEMPARSTSGVNNINTGEVRGLAIPLPPLCEQQEIVQRVSQLLEIADRLRRTIENALKRVDRSSQAILAKAFRGELITSGEKGAGL